MRTSLVLAILLSCVLISNCVENADRAKIVPKGVLEGTGHTVGYGILDVSRSRRRRRLDNQKLSLDLMRHTLMQEEWRGEVIHLSWAPRAFLLKGFLSDEECDHLIKLVSCRVAADGEWKRGNKLIPFPKGEPSLTKSAVAESKTGKSVDSHVRTSLGTFLNKDHDEIITKIERRVAQVTMIPVGEGRGVLRLLLQRC